MNVRLSSALAVLLLVFFRPDTSFTQSFYNPAVAVSSDGTCAVAYNAAAHEGGSVVLVLIDSSGRRLLPPVIVNAGLSGYGQNPSVVYDHKNRVSIVWEQWETGSEGPGLHRARYGMDGTRLGAASERVVDGKTVNAQTPRIAVAPDGRSVVVWLDYRLGHPAVYAQRFTKEGKKEGGNIRIADGREGLIQTPAVSIDQDNLIGFIWQETIRDSFRIVCARAPWNLRKTTRVIIDNGRGQAYASTPDIASALPGVFLCVWKDYRTGESNIFTQRIGRSRDRKVANLQLNDDTTRNWQRLPRIAAASRAGCMLVWEDYRNDRENQAGDIYAQSMSPEGEVTGANFRVNDSPEPSVQRFPAVGMNAEGAWAVVWSDSRSGATEVHLRRGRLFKDGTTGPDIRVAP